MTEKEKEQDEEAPTNPLYGKFTEVSKALVKDPEETVKYSRSPCPRWKATQTNKSPSHEHLAGGLLCYRKERMEHSMLTNTCSFVFIGAFELNPVDESHLFEGKIDAQGRMITDRFVQCSYMGGKFQLTVVPNKIAVKAENQNIMSSDLVTAAESVIEQFQSLGKGVRVSGFGMNCDALFERNLLPYDELSGILLSFICESSKDWDSKKSQVKQSITRYRKFSS